MRYYTAIEYFLNQLLANGIDLDKVKNEMIIAKHLEKEQIIEAWADGSHQGWEDCDLNSKNLHFEGINNGVDYYKNKYDIYE